VSSTLRQGLAAGVPVKIVFEIIENHGSARPCAVFVQVHNAGAPRSNPINKTARIAGLTPAVALKHLAIFRCSLVALLRFPAKLGAETNKTPVLIVWSN